MQETCLRHSEIAGASRLFVDYLYDFERVSAFYTHNPLDPASLALTRTQVDYPDERRAAVVDALGEINENQPSLTLLAERGTVAVLTGQQVGLYGGPVYTLYKALTAIATARQLSAQGTPAVPVFWLATEDHDVEEVTSALFFEGEVKAEAASDGRPAGLHLLAGLRKDLALAGEVATLAAKHYQDGKTFGASFLGLLQELLCPFGMLFVDPLEPKLRAVGAAFLAGADGLDGLRQIAPCRGGRDVDRLDGLHGHGDTPADKQNDQDRDRHFDMPADIGPDSFDKTQDGTHEEERETESSMDARMRASSR